MVSGRISWRGAAGVGVRFLVELEAGKATAQIGKVLAVLAALGCNLRIEPPRMEASTGSTGRRVATMTRSLTVWWEGAVVGSLTADRHGAMRFTYDGNWLADPAAPALSVSLPKRPEPFPPRQCRPFFEGLLPEGRTARCGCVRPGHIAGKRVRAARTAGRGGGGGRSRCTRTVRSRLALETQGPAIALTDDELAGLLPSLETRPFLAGTRGLRLSLAGAQSKLPVVLIDGRIGLPAPGQPTTHILKPPIARFPATTENEAFAMRLAAGLGLDAAPVEPYVAGGGGTACW